MTDAILALAGGLMVCKSLSNTVGSISCVIRFLKYSIEFFANYWYEYFRVLYYEQRDRWCVVASAHLI